MATYELGSGVSILEETNIPSSFKTCSFLSWNTTSSSPESKKLLPPQQTPKWKANNTEILDYESKCMHTKAKSSIHAALKNEDPATGILRFFHKASEKEHQNYLNHTSEEVWNHADELCAQKLHDTLWNLEIAMGLHSPGGRKQQVWNSGISELELTPILLDDWCEATRSS